MAGVEQRIDYKRGLRAGDVVTIRSAVLEVMEKAIRIVHEMRNDETGARVRARNESHIGRTIRFVRDRARLPKPAAPGPMSARADYA